jgi:Tol biopolymer transport system component/DNA-binding winged helix-turn-helix (wHTH) protein
MRGDSEIPLTGKAFEVLLLLVQSSGRTVSREAFMEKVWRDVIVDESNLSDNVFTLRQVLEDDAREPRYIKTVPRRGYRFVANVNVVAETAQQTILVRERHRTDVVIEEEHPSLLSRNQQWVAIAGLVAVVGAVAFTAGRSRTTPADVVRRQAPIPPPIVRPLTTNPEPEFSPALSPDGKLVAYARLTSREAINIYVKQVEAGTPVLVTVGPGREGSPVWSPDGHFLAYIHSGPDQENSSIRIIPSLGGPHRTIFSAHHLGMLAWSWDGRTIAFSQKSSPGQPFSLTLLDVKTLETRVLTEAPADSLGDYYLAFSPDDRSIAFVRLIEDWAGDIYTIAVEGGAPRRLTFDDRDIVGLAWDTKTDAILFSSNRQDRQGLWRVPAAGGTPVALEPAVEQGRDPKISRDGRSLVCTTMTSNSDIYKLDIGSSTATPVPLIASTRHDRYPRVSSEGRVIAFVSDRSGQDQIWIAASDGSSPRQLTDTRASPATQPAISADGREVAYVSRPAGATSDIYVVGIEGGTPRRLTKGLNGAAPAWSRDGRTVYFSASSGGDWQVWRVPASGGVAQQVTRNGGYESAESSDGKFLFYTKYGLGRIGLFRQRIDGGAEEMIAPLLQLVSLGDWQVTTGGVYFVHRYDSPKGVPAKRPAIRFLDFATGGVRDVVPFPDPGTDPGLTVVDGGKSIVYSRVSNTSIDLMLVSNYR